MRTGESHHQCARQVGQRETQVAEQRRVERGGRFCVVGFARGFDFLQHERMAADGALAEHDQASRQDVRAFDGDQNRQLHIRGADEIRRTHADTFAAGDVHCIGDDLAAPLGEMQLRDTRKDGGLLAQIDRACGQHARRVHHVEVAAHARQRLFDPFEHADRRLELLAYARIAARRTHRELRHAGARCGEGYAASRGERLHQHSPAVAQHRLSADDPIHRNENVAPPRGPVLEHRVERHVTTADLDAVLARVADHIGALRLRAQVASDAGDNARAAACWQRFLALERAPTVRSAGDTFA